MDITTALAKIENQPEGQAINAYINDLRNKDVVALGTDEAFALRDATGQIKAFRQGLTLSNQNGGLIQPVPGGPHVVSAQGYEIWAEAVGASVIFPKEVLVGNKWMQNPYAERDPENRRILAVHARAIAFRFSSKGIPQVSDWTTIFDTPSYRLIDLLAKAKKTPQAFKLLPSELGKPEEPGTWAAYPFDESTNLWVNTAHDEALTWYAQILNREKKSMDFAQTFAKRNALKHLSGLQKAPGPQWNLSVLSWRPTSGNIIKWDATQYSQLQDRVGGMISGNNAEFEGQPKIEMRHGSENVSDETNYAALESETDPEDQQEILNQNVGNPERVERHATKADLSPEEKKIMDNYNVVKNNFPDECGEAFNNLNIVTGQITTPDIAKLIIKEVNRILDTK